MNRFFLALISVACVMGIVLLPKTAMAGFYYTSGTDSVSPDAPSTWTSDTDGYIGYTADGELTVDGGSGLLSRYGYIGYTSGVSGTVTVTGSSSTWTNDGYLYVGGSGSGTLAITNGGSISNGYFGCIGKESGSTGTATVDGSGSVWKNNDYLYVGGSGSGTLAITNSGSVSVANTTFVGSEGMGKIDFGANGGTLTTAALAASSSQLTGAGIINAYGLVSDIDLLFDSTASLTRTIYFNSLTDQNVTINLDMSNTAINSSLGAGYESVGSLTIRNGIAVQSTYGYLGYKTGSTGTATVDGVGSTWTNDRYLYVGRSGSGTLAITNGGSVISLMSEIAVSSGSTGTVTVDGSGSTWTHHGRAFNVGCSGNGTLLITNGGAVSSALGNIGSAGGTGRVTVDGSGSTWTNGGPLDVGFIGGGTLTITGGGAVTSDECDIGSLNSSTGAVTVDGPDSTWTCDGHLDIGYMGSGTLTITGGGAVTSGGCDIGFSSSSTGAVTVDGPDSTWTTNGSLRVGLSGNGTLTITNGGAVSNHLCSIDASGNSTSEVIVDGPGSTWTNNGDLFVGNYGTGIITQTGGAVSVAGTLTFGHYSSGSGVYNLNGGVLALGGLTAGDGSAAFNFGGGTLKVTNDLATSVDLTLTGDGGNASVDTDGYDVAISGILSGMGGLAKLGSGTLTLTGANTYTGLTTVEAGTLELATSAQDPVLTLGGGANVNGGILIFDYAGSDPVDAITAGIQSGLIYSSGTSSIHQLGLLDDGSSQITLMLTISGDADLDGSVNGTDLNTLLSNYNQSGTYWYQGDFNYDGSVNGTDLNTLLSNYNQSLSSSTPAVPEPGMLMLLAVGVLSMAACVWRKRS